MKIERTNRSGKTARTLARTGASALGIGVVAVLALTGCAQSDVGGSEVAGSTTTTSPSPEESDVTSPSPSDGAEDGKLPEAAEMEIVAGAKGRGLPPGLEGSTESTAGVAWAPEPGLLYVVTNGSSSCPTFAEPEATIGSGGKSDGVAAADGVLAVTFVPADNGICTMDFVPTTTVVEAPAEADTGRPVPVQLGDKGKVELEPRDADGEAGPVAWLDS
ncbi:hypothetical protein [Promicromonospora sp. MEB111]|uniref:hypothetical protein n=1 Tax=Promicromonospora sp. MEB111 TaxID=3040301 RepID=UPI00254A920D|nr:hypothetical protein [Promicromonospora sp. MEB111]